MKKLILAVLAVLVLGSVCFAEYTGLIIDAQGLGVRPGMSPKIIDDNGNVVYGVVYADSETIATKGIIKYADNLEEAKDDGTVGSNPLIIKARTRGANPLKTDVIVSLRNAQQIVRANAESDFLADFRVIIVL